MARITVEDCLTKVTNRFALVMLAAKRAKQIMKGSNPLVASKDNKAVVTTLREIADGRVWYDIDPTEGTPADQIQRDLNR